MAGLSACTKCYSRQPFDELSKEEHLCKVCRRKYPLTPCTYCQLEFHILQKVDGSPVCSKCSHNLSTYGKPTNCKYCDVKAAFKNHCCSRCISAEKRYGAPKQCQKCKKNAAFDKGMESQVKVGGKILCLQCTLDYKRIRHKQQKEQRKAGLYGQSNNLSGSLSSSNVAPLKAENLAVSLKSRMEAVERNSRQGSRSSSPFRPLGVQDSASENTTDPHFGDQMSEITKLRDQIAGMKKVISQKEKIILEKDKKINEFQAEQWEKDKQWRHKVQTVQKESNLTIQSLQAENNSLKKQVARLSSSRKSSKVERPTTRIRLEPYKLGVELLSSEKKNTTPYDSPAESESMEPSDTGNQGLSDETITKAESQESTDAVVLKEKIEDEVDDKIDDATDEAVLKSPDEEDDMKVESEMRNSMSFDEAQEAGIKNIMNLTAGDDYASSGRDDGEQTVERVSRKRRKRKSKLTVEDDDEDDDGDNDDIKIHAKKKKRKKKSQRIIDENEFVNDETGRQDRHNLKDSTEEKDNSDEEDDNLYAPTDPDETEPDVDSLNQPSGHNFNGDGRDDEEDKDKRNGRENVDLPAGIDTRGDESVSSVSSDSDDSSDKLQVVDE